jgi:F0F1-type ATP synthase membrane subunit a
MESQELSPTSYISHHLANRTISLGDSPFWTLHVDTLVMSALLGVIAFGLLWLVVRGATAGVPGKRQAFVELAVGFIDDQAKGIFHGDRSFVGPLALTVFVWVILMNAMDFLPVDVTGLVYEHVFHQQVSAAGSTSSSARRSAQTRCCGPPTFSSISSSTCRSPCRTRCGSSATCTRAS